MLALWQPQAICRTPTLLLRQVYNVPRTFSRSSFSAGSKKKQMPSRPKVDDNELEENFLKGSGPGGQKINKTSSAVQLKHLPTGIVVKSQATRSRSQNRTIARRLLAEKLEIIEKGSESRVMMKAAVKQKKKASSVKKSKRKYRTLAEQKGSALKEEKVDMTDGQEESLPLDASHDKPLH